MEYRV